MRGINAADARGGDGSAVVPPDLQLNPTLVLAHRSTTARLRHVFRGPALERVLKLLFEPGCRVQRGGS